MFDKLIPRVLTLRDPADNRFTVKVRVRDGVVQLYEGWHAIGGFYKLHYGGWLQFVRQNDTLFEMRVWDRLFI